MLFHRKKKSKLHSPWLQVQRLASTSFLFDSHFTGNFWLSEFPTIKLVTLQRSCSTPQWKSTTKKHIQKTKPRQIFGTLGSEHQTRQISGRIWITKSKIPLQPSGPSVVGNCRRRGHVCNLQRWPVCWGVFWSKFGRSSELLIWSDVVDYPYRYCVGVLHTYIQIQIISK